MLTEVGGHGMEQGPGVYDMEQGLGVSDMEQGPGISEIEQRPGAYDMEQESDVSDVEQKPGVSGMEQGPGDAGDDVMQYRDYESADALSSSSAEEEGEEGQQEGEEERKEERGEQEEDGIEDKGLTMHIPHPTLEERHKGVGGNVGKEGVGEREGDVREKGGEREQGSAQLEVSSPSPSLLDPLQNGGERERSRNMVEVSPSPSLCSSLPYIMLFLSLPLFPLPSLKLHNLMINILPPPSGAIECPAPTSCGPSSPPSLPCPQGEAGEDVNSVSVSIRV